MVLFSLFQFYVYLNRKSLDSHYVLLGLPKLCQW